MKLIIVILAMALASCAAQQERIESDCGTRIIDDEKKVLITRIRHECGAIVTVTSSQPYIKVKLIESQPENLILVTGLPE